MSREVVAEWVEQLRTERLSRGWTQLEVAEEMGEPCSQGQVSNWEGGRYQPTVGCLLSWADALGFEVVLRRVQQ